MCALRQGMEESYETFEEEFGPPRADPPPQKPVRQIRRPGGKTQTHLPTQHLHCLHIKALSIVHILHRTINTAAQGATET